MKIEVKNMATKIIFFNVIVGTIISMLVYFFTKAHIGVCLLGLLVAYLSFLLNAVITEKIVLNPNIQHNLYSLVWVLIRTLLVCVIGIMVYTYNNLNIIFYIIGYSSQFISIMLYSLFIKENI